jgi:hypothetical protein
MTEIRGPITEARIKKVKLKWEVGMRKSELKSMGQRAKDCGLSKRKRKATSGLSKL